MVGGLKNNITKILTLSLFLLTSIATHAQVDPLDLQAIRNWVGDQTFQVEFESEVHDNEIRVDDFGVAQPPYRSYKHDFETHHRHSTTFHVSTTSANQRQVIFYGEFIHDAKFMLTSAPNYRQLAWSYLQAHLPSDKINTLQPTSSPSVFAPILPSGVIDWYKRVEVFIRDTGEVNYVYMFDGNTPLYSGDVAVSLAQAQTYSSAYTSSLFMAPMVIEYPNTLDTNDLIMAPDALGVWQPVWRRFTTVTSDEDDVGFYVYVNAVDGSVFDDRDQWLGGIIDSKPKFGKQIGFRILRDGQIIRTGKHTDVPIGWLQALAKGHKLSAKAGEKAFNLDGKRVALPAKVTAKAGTLYLPWQALKSLPGIKCSYDAKLNRLDITTAKAAKSATKPAAAK